MADTSGADDQRLRRILAACAAIEDRLARDRTADDIDVEAIRAKLMEIGDDVRAVDPLVLAAEPEVAWSDAARMGKLLADAFFDSGHPMILATAENDVPRLRVAAERLLEKTPDNGLRPEA